MAQHPNGKPPNPTGKGLIFGRWKPGESGNPGGRPSEKAFVKELRIVLNAQDKGALKQIVQKLVDCALEGESWAIQMVCERLDGKTPQEIKVTRDVREMSLDDILGELAEARAAAGVVGEDAGAGESGSVH